MFQSLSANGKKTYLAQEMSSYLGLLKSEISMKKGTLSYHDLMSRRLSTKTESSTFFQEILEKCFFILWRHVEFFCSFIEHGNNRAPHLENPLNTDRKSKWSLRLKTASLMSGHLS